MHIHTRERESRDYARDARAVSHVHTSEPRPRCSCNCVCRLGMLEVVWRRLSVGALAAWSLRSLSLSLLFHFAPLLCFSISLSLSLSPSLYSVHSSPHPSPVPPNSPPFLYLPLTHLICLCSLPWLLYSPLSLSLSRSFCLQNPCWRGLSFSSRRDPNSVSVAVISENQALVFSLPLCPLPSPSSRNATIVFLILED